MKRVAALVLVVLLAPTLSALAPLPGLAPSVAAPPPADVLQRAIVRLDGGDVPLPGVRVLYRFETVDARLVEGTPRAVAALASLAGVARVEPEEPIVFDLDTATLASRARDVWDQNVVPATPVLRDASGDLVDGAGVGIAVVDTGFDPTHPDLDFAGHWLVFPTGLVAAEQSAVNSPHGTHVAGIAAGSGAASGGTHTGVAPGAALYGFARGGSGLGTSFPAVAFDWILAHGHEQDPPIRIVTNSWHCGSVGCNRVDGAPLHRDLATRLAEAGYVMVFSVGNDGGLGTEQRTSLEATLPTPGILGVGNYDDVNLGLRSQCPPGSSSRGDASDPRTWPDVLAPGVLVASAWPVYAGQDTRDPTGKNTYRQMTGTSMSAPHVAGIAALLLQANPDLSPAEVEYILKATATKLDCGRTYVRADPAHPYDGAHYGEGHGLVDAYAAVELATGFAGVPPPPAVEPIPPSFLPRIPAVRERERIYLDGEAALAAGRPAATDDDRLEVLPANRDRAFTSAPFAETTTVSGFEAVLWIGVTGEPLYSSLPSHVEARVERIRADGTVEPLAKKAPEGWFTTTGAPRVREFLLLPASTVTFEPGDRLRLVVQYVAPVFRAVAEQRQAHALLAWDGDAYPAFLLLGDRIESPAPGTVESCQARDFRCARIDMDRRLVTPHCEANNLFRVHYEGPGGSRAVVQCYNAVAECSVPDDVVWGTCEAVGFLSGPLAAAAGTVCTYRVPAGKPEGHGWCEWWGKKPYAEPLQ